MNVEDNSEGLMALLKGVTRQGSWLGLERMNELLRLLGDPHKELRFIHVAGTNGKGSVCVMLSSILTAAGYVTGLYTSPHLVTYGECMRVNGENISEAELCVLATTVRLCAEQMAENPTEFEILTAMALLYFSQKHCDIVVLEVGLGGRLDATNVIPVPEVAVIMNIGLEHTDVLGNTLEQIAGEKAGIIKEGGVVVVYQCVSEVEAVFETVCASRHASLRKARFIDVIFLEENLDRQCFHWRQFSNLTIRLLGKHQIYNAVMALETVELLYEKGWNIPETAIRDGLAAAKWPARLELLSREPMFILDGAHNAQCAQALSESIRQLFPGKKPVFLTGVLADKDYPQIMSLITPLAQEFFCLTPFSERALHAEELTTYLKEQGAKAVACGDVESGIFAALTAAGEEGIVVAFGSLYLAGGVRETFRPIYRKWLRKEKIRARNQLSTYEREILSSQAVQRILASVEFQQAETIMIYRATRGEVRLEALEAAARGKRLVYPLCISDTEMLALLPENDDAWITGNYGIAEPDPKKSTVVSPEEIDMVICPCTVFDESCNRMGMGAGFYDRYLTRCENACIASVAFEVQKVGQVPTDSWDIPMELTFTEKAIYRSN